MEVSIHFIFELFKIAILASFYSALLLLVIVFINCIKPNELCNNVLSKKYKIWFYGGCSISIVLFFYMFSYLGNHGLGDSAQIPIGNNEIISNINWEDNCSLENRQISNGNSIDVEKFIVSNNKLFAKFDNQTFYDYNNEYFIFDLITKEIKEYNTESVYNNFAKENNLPLSDEMMSFKHNYNNYWSGWRLFLLP